jgi:selenium metabolism protein YedF
MNLDDDLLLLCKSAGVGDGEPDLGEKLMKSFLTMLLESGRLPARCVFINSGIFLTTEGSPVLDLLQQYERAGSQIFSCGTCLEYYNRTEKLQIGQPTNMRDTVAAMLEYGKVLTP